MENNRRVFIPMVNEKFDISMAKEFGEVLPLVSCHLNPFNTDETIKLLSEALKEAKFDFEVDYICMTGQAIILAITLAILSSEYRRINMLLFDATSQKYRCRVFDFSQENQC